MELYERYKQAEAQIPADMDEQRVQVIMDKVATAEELIKEAGIAEYTTNDVADVVTALITDDLEKEELYSKNAAVAEELIKEAGITEYAPEDVAEVVTALIAKNIQDEEENQKIAELKSYGYIMADSFDERTRQIAEERK